MNPDNVFQKNQNPVTAFLDSIGVAKVGANGQATGTTGGAVHMWDDQTAKYNELLGASQGQVQPGQAPDGNAFLQAPGTTTPTAAPMAANAFLGGSAGPMANATETPSGAPAAPTGQTWINTAPGTRQANQDGSTPMLGRPAAPVATPAATPLSSFGNQVLNSPTPISRDGATFSGAGGKLSITQDMGTVPMGGKPAAGGVDPLAVARYQQAVASGGDVNALLSAYRTPIPEGVTLTEQEMAQLAMDDQRINQQAMELAGRVTAQGMNIRPETPSTAIQNRMDYVSGLANTGPAAATPAGSIRDRLNQKPMKTVDVVVGDEIVTMDANTRQVIGRAPRTALPAGYERAPDGSIRPMAGSKDAVERETVAKKENLKRAQDTEKANVVIAAIDDVMPKVNNLTAGLGGALTSFVPGSEGYDVGSTIDTIKANIGFDQLSAMRAASPTGGALGQVAVQELNFLQATIGNLKQGQSPDKLRENLYAVKYHYDRWKDTLNGIDPDTKPGRMLSPAEAKRLQELKQRKAGNSNQSGRPGTKG